MVILYPLFFGFWLLYLHKRNEFSVALLLIFIYFFSSVCCMWLISTYPNEIDVNRITFSSVFFHIIVLFLFLQPITRFAKRFKVEFLQIRECLATKVFLYILSVPGILAVLFSFYDVLHVFSMGNMLDARNEFLNGDLGSFYISRHGILGYVPSLGLVLSFANLFFFFYRYFLQERKDLISILLFVASFAIVFNNLAIAGREGLLRWCFYFVFCLVAFKRRLSWKKYKIFWITIIVFIIVILSIFYIISADRFSDRNYGILYFILDYYGQPFYYFSYNFQRFGLHGNGFGMASLFPFFTFSDNAEIYNLNDIIYADYKLNTFSTFVGTFLVRTGALTTFLMGVIFFIVCNLILRIKRNGFVYLSMFLLFLFLYEIEMLGVFYFLYSAVFTQFTMVLYYFIARFYQRKIV